MLPKSPKLSPLRIVSALQSFSNCQNRIQESRELIANHQNRFNYSQREITFHTFAIRHHQEAIRQEADILSHMEEQLVHLHDAIVSMGYARTLHYPEKALEEILSITRAEAGE
jgi:hypothetical protein